MLRTLLVLRNIVSLFQMKPFMCRARKHVADRKTFMVSLRFLFLWTKQQWRAYFHFCDTQLL